MLVFSSCLDPRNTDRRTQNLSKCIDGFLKSQQRFYEAGEALSQVTARARAHTRACGRADNLRTHRRACASLRARVMHASAYLGIAGFSSGL